MLMQGFWLERRRRTLTVHMPEDGIAPVKRLLDAGCVFEDLLSFRLRFRTLRARRSVVMRGVEVTPCPTTHLDQLGAIRIQVRSEVREFQFPDRWARDAGGALGGSGCGRGFVASVEQAGGSSRVRAGSLRRRASGRISAGQANREGAVRASGAGLAAGHEGHAQAHPGRAWENPIQDRGGWRPSGGSGWGGWRAAESGGEGASAATRTDTHVANEVVGGDGVATLISRVLGLVREQVYAGFMGDGVVASAFKLAYQAPNLFRRLPAKGR